MTKVSSPNCGRQVNQLKLNPSIRSNCSRRKRRRWTKKKLATTVIALVSLFFCSLSSLHLVAQAQLSTGSNHQQTIATDQPYNEQTSNSLDLQEASQKQQQQQQQTAANQLRDQTLQLILAKLIPTIWSQPQSSSNLASELNGEQQQQQQHHNNSIDDSGSDGNNIAPLEQQPQPSPPPPPPPQQHQRHHHQSASSSYVIHQQQQLPIQQTDAARLYTASGKYNLPPAGHHPAPLYHQQYQQQGGQQQHQPPNEHFQPAQVAVNEATNQHQHKPQSNGPGQLMAAELAMSSSSFAPTATNGVAALTANSQSPIRQLISPQANNLYYPPGETLGSSDSGGVDAGGATNQQQPPSAAGEQQLHPNYQSQLLPAPQMYANYHPPLSIQMPRQQQQPQSQQQQQLQYRPLNMQPQLPPQPSQAWQPQYPVQQPIPIQLQQQQSRPIAMYPLGLPPVLQPLVDQQSNVAAHLSQNPPSSSTGSALLSFLANNKANLSNMIQLLPVVAQAFATIPKILAPQASGPLIMNPAGSNRSSSTTAATAAVTAANAIADKLAERIHQSSSSDTPTNSKPTANSIPDNKWPSWLATALSGGANGGTGNSLSNSAPALLSSLLPTLTRHFLSSSSSSAPSIGSGSTAASSSPLSASPPYEFVSSLQQSPAYSLLGLQASASSEQPAGISAAGNLMRDLLGAWMSGASRRTMSRDPNGYQESQQQSSPQQQQPITSMARYGSRWLSQWLQNQRKQELNSGPRSTNHFHVPLQETDSSTKTNKMPAELSNIKPKSKPTPQPSKKVDHLEILSSRTDVRIEGLSNKL